MTVIDVPALIPVAPTLRPLAVFWGRLRRKAGPVELARRFGPWLISFGWWPDGERRRQLVDIPHLAASLSEIDRYLAAVVDSPKTPATLRREAASHRSLIEWVRSELLPQDYTVAQG